MCSTGHGQAPNTGMMQKRPNPKQESPFRRLQSTGHKHTGIEIPSNCLTLNSSTMKSVRLGLWPKPFFNGPGTEWEILNSSMVKGP